MKEEGEVRTDMYCHDCDKNFLGIIDYNINGNHTIICPHCGHNHCRVIEDGKITGERWDSKFSNSVEVRTQKLWNHNTIKASTSSASEFLRNRWLNRDDVT